MAKTPIDAYREGYEKGKSNNLVGHTAEAVFGLLRDDPGGHFMDGYRNGSAAKPFRPPLDKNDRKNSGSMRFW